MAKTQPALRLERNMQPYIITGDEKLGLFATANNVTFKGARIEIRSNNQECAANLDLIGFVGSLIGCDPETYKQKVNALLERLGPTVRRLYVQHEYRMVIVSMETTSCNGVEKALAVRIEKEKAELCLVAALDRISFVLVWDSH